MCSNNKGSEYIQWENLRSPIFISDIVPILSSLTGGPPGKGGGQQDKNDGGALNFDPGYMEKKSGTVQIKRKYGVLGFYLGELRETIYES